MTTTTFGVGIPAPEPGFYVGIPQDVYHAWDACSNSRLQLLKRSPAHLKAHVIHGSAETDALRFGSAAHMSILEPELFSVRYGLKGQCEGKTQKGERCSKPGAALVGGKQFCGLHQSGEVEATVLLSADDHAACLAMRESVASKLRASRLIAGDGHFELSIVWDEDIEIGPDTVTVRCKGRIDRYSPALDGGAIVDLKTTTDADPSEFERAVFRYGYHEQAGLYMRGARKVNLPAKHYAIMAAEKAPPYEVSVFRLSEGAIDGGEQMALSGLARYARCLLTGMWNGYPDQVRDLALPDWAWKQMDDQLNEEAAWSAAL